MTNLHTLEVFDFKFGDELIFELVEGPLLKSDKLNTLRLCGCNISDEGASAIAKTLEFVGMMSGVKTLELSNNKVGDIGAHAIASMLCNDSSSSVPLLSLELDSNMISEVGGVELCKAAKGALVLQRLNLSHNSIGDATVVEMADAIRFNAGTLREVLLSGARAKEESIAYLLRASSRSTALQLLDIRGLPLSLDTVSHASALLKQTNSLHALMLEVSSREAAESLARESRGFRNHIQLTVGGPIPLGLLSQMGEVIGASTVRIQNSGSMVPESSIVRAWIEDSVKSTQQYHGSNSSSTLNSNLFPSSHPNPSDRLPCPPPLPSSFDSFPVSPMSSINRAPSPSIPAPASAASIFTIPSPASPPIASPSLPSTSQPTTPRTSMRGVEGSALSGSASANNPGINNNNNRNNNNFNSNINSNSSYGNVPLSSIGSLGNGTALPYYVVNPPRSPRSETAESTISRFTHRTGRTNRTNRTSTSFLSFDMSDVSRRTYTIGDQQLRMSASLAAGGAALKAAVIFRKHDENQDNFLNKQELLQALEEMGVLQGIKARHVSRFVDAEFKKADWDQDGKVSLQDFITYYDRIAHYQTHVAREGRIKSMTNLNRQMIPRGVENHPHLKKVFRNYCKLALGQGRIYADVVPRMNAQQFHRFCQDAGFMEPDGRLSSTTLDVVFYRYRIASCRRLGLKEFVEALSALAYEMGMQFDDVMEVIGCGSNSPGGIGGATTAGEESDGGGGIGERGGERGERGGGSNGGGGSGGGAGSMSGLRSDISFDVLVPLPTVVEGAETTAASGGKTGKKKKIGSKSGKNSKSAAANANAGLSGQGISNGVDSHHHHHLSHDHLPMTPLGATGGGIGSSGGAGVNQAAAAPTSTFAVVDGKSIRSVGVSSADLEALESRIKADLDAKLSDMAAERVSSMAKMRHDMAASIKQGELQTSSLLLSQAKLANDVRACQERVETALKELEGLKERVEAVYQKSEANDRMDGNNNGGGNSASNDNSAWLSQQQAEVAKLEEAIARMGGNMSETTKHLLNLQTQNAEALAMMEKKVLERQGRYEGALMQVAKQVDALDHRMREEQESNLKLAEQLMSSLPQRSIGRTPNTPSGTAAEPAL
eukprot:CAMPEP_0175072134 /NCGR_PEP_ID=MMETSP0052_2-20121109/19707_1 /TAXON_ID=51329 ORGANISM="Polytomella parva, Strain SAG 63-3" /NCGR_SAMPLE_ID=MMETSP0052_2 /ASSEMBLY_ACC=CAM_ASM_000194 /LENGTH=1112 /DNA_ID=CAMNT_0016339537 /DNA_START=508 /DNA_END=3848 /DNA_ORIENTATION=+